MTSRKHILVSVIALIVSINTFGQTIKVAVAANLQSVIKVLGDDFKKRSGVTIEPIVGSSGKLVAQIANGAPYDVFLSADMEFSQKLSDAGLTEQAPVVYALGSLIICTTQNISLKNWDKLITTDQVGKIAIANAAIAPYGRAAEETLTKLNLLDKVKPKLVYGESISQVNTYITTGVASVGFTTQSLVMDPANTTKINWQRIDTKTYAPIQQGMVLLKKATNKVNAEKFYKYTLSAPAKSILKKYGYIIP
ncbi:molybdate ABC transporter substrate-binding protein [Mucilaginibacter mali]|uniref:Molybdate ABC transporter substrate-binding protein n=1 Tax=Mucilaginibacter mali TaxID=2740462 RepID=A0A7D4Q372_9SPHI|nr:molybdate ABC transporter substrate-binding protein [Mucilaginibacter mali]QKJ30107.1 molybdate ABC transporter substrate-binding protein [Mucilaginibacter mali]